MVDRGEQFGFALKPREILRILCERRWNDLDRDRAVEPRIAAEVHDAHAASSELAFDRVRAKPGRRRHEWRQHSAEGYSSRRARADTWQSLLRLSADHLFNLCCRWLRPLRE